MTGIKLLITPFLLGSLTFGGINPTNIEKTSDEQVEIKLERESEFYPKKNYKDTNLKNLSGTIADDNSKYRDGEGGLFNKNIYRSEWSADNGKFIFTLPDNYSEISIDTTIKVSGMYDQYYTKLDGLVVPTGADTIVSSQEIFNLKGTATKGGEMVKIGSGEVAIIIDMWGGNNFGYGNVDWYMGLNDYGNQLTIICDGYETGNIWAGGSPGWFISEMTTANTTDEEFHKTVGSGTTLKYYNFQDPEDYHDNYLYVYGIM